MGTRDARNVERELTKEATRATSRTATKQDVYGSHGNDYLRDRLGAADRARGTDSSGSALDAASREAAKEPPKLTERVAVQEVVDSLVHLQDRPRLLEEVLAGARTHEEQASQVLRYLAEEGLDTAVLETLSQAKLTNLSQGMVVQSDALRAVEGGCPEVRELGFAGAVIWQILAESLQHSGPAAAAGAAGEEAVKQPDPRQSSRALAGVIATLRLAATNAP